MDHPSIPWRLPLSEEPMKALVGDAVNSRVQRGLIMRLITRVGVRRAGERDVDNSEELWVVIGVLEVDIILEFMSKLKLELAGVRVRLEIPLELLIRRSLIAYNVRGGRCGRIARFVPRRAANCAGVAVLVNPIE